MFVSHVSAVPVAEAMTQLVKRGAGVRSVVCVVFQKAPFVESISFSASQSVYGCHFPDNEAGVVDYFFEEHIDVNNSFVGVTMQFASVFFQFFGKFL